jgi:hypothetical protein
VLPSFLSPLSCPRPLFNSSPLSHFPLFSSYLLSFVSYFVYSTVLFYGGKLWPPETAAALILQWNSGWKVHPIHAQCPPHSQANMKPHTMTQFVAVLVYRSNPLAGLKVHSRHILDFFWMFVFVFSTFFRTAFLIDFPLIEYHLYENSIIKN